LRRNRFGLHALGEAEVGHVRRALGIQQDIGRLQIPVEDAVLMGVVHRTADHRQEPDSGAGVLSQAGEFVFEAASLDQFHAEVVLPSILAHFVNGNDVRMIELGGGFGFGVEALHVSCRGELPGQK
jgi:hypothetical protein